jgi:quinol monooxygenase YgiN
LTIKDGQQQAFAALMREMVAATKMESGTMVYEWYLGAACVTLPPV